MSKQTKKQYCEIVATEQELDAAYDWAEANLGKSTLADFYQHFSYIAGSAIELDDTDYKTLLFEIKKYNNKDEIFESVVASKAYCTKLLDYRDKLAILICKSLSLIPEEKE